jgi:ACT domain-containing protein
MNKTIEIIRFLRHNPMSSTSEILLHVNISQAGFYRHKKTALKILGVEISFSTHGNNQGYEITSYGIIDRYKL